MAKKGFLEKLGLVAPIESEVVPETNIITPSEPPKQDVVQSSHQSNIEPEQFPETIADIDNIIDKIYSENNISDRTKSIYKVAEFISALPKEMPSNIKQTSVLSILDISGLKVEDLTLDASNRVDLLDEQMNNIKDKNDAKISEAETDIENMKQMIDDLNKVIYNAKIETEKTQEIIHTEKNNLFKLIEFIGGTK